MTMGDYVRYWIPATANIVGVSSAYIGHETSMILGKMLGIDEMEKYIVDPIDQDKPMSDELKELLIKLAGPYGKTILKVYRVKKGLENEGR